MTGPSIEFRVPPWRRTPTYVPDGITVLGFGLDRIDPEDGWLDDTERRRAFALRTELLSRRFRAAHTVLRAALAGAIGCDPAAIRFRPSPHGKPAIDAPQALHFNLSHSADQALVAIGPGPLGVDIEANAPRLRDDENLAEWILDPAALATWRAMEPAQRSDELYRVWTLKEAFVKARGTGLGDEPLAGYVLPSSGFGPIAAGPASGPAWWVRPLPAPWGFHAAFSTLGMPPPIRVFRLADAGWEQTFVPDL
jgi:4'-phosphopantetheinyl transferase